MIDDDIGSLMILPGSKSIKRYEQENNSANSFYLILLIIFIFNLILCLPLLFFSFDRLNSELYFKLWFLLIAFEFLAIILEYLSRI